MKREELINTVIKTFGTDKAHDWWEEAQKWLPSGSITAAVADKENDRVYVIVEESHDSRAVDYTMYRFFSGIHKWHVSVDLQNVTAAAIFQELLEKN